MDSSKGREFPALFAFSLIFIFTAVLFAQAYSGFSYQTSDAYERARSAQYLISYGYPVQSTAIGAGATSYPPIFDFSLAAVHQLTGLSYELCEVALSFVYAALFLCLGFLFSRVVLRELGKEPDEALCCLSGIAVFLSPWVFFLSITPVSDSLGMALCFLAVYFFYRQSKWLTFTILTVLSLAHFRSFLACGICLGVLALYQRRIRELLFESFLSILIFIYFVPKTALGFSNPLVITPGVFEFFSLALLLFGAAGVILLAFGRKFPPIIIALFAAPVILSAFAPFAFRQLPFLVLPLAAVSVLFFEGFSDAFGPSTFRLAFFCVLAISALSINSFVTAKYLPLGPEASSVAYTVSQFNGRNVYADFVQSYAIPMYSPQKRVLLGSFAEELPDFSSRLYIDQAITNGSIDSNAATLMQLYQIDLVESNYSASYDPLGLGGDRVFQSDSYSAYSLS